jgi:cytochrome c oxidase subunit II
MNPEPTIQMPGQWSTFAPQVDWLYYFIYWLSVVLFVGIIGAALYFVWKYQRKPGVAAEPTGHNLPLEIGWTVAPVFILAALFHWGFQGYVHMTVPPGNAMEIRVRAQKWSWNFQYPNGASETNTLHVPVNRPVRLVMSSGDVLHSFYVPSFRVKKDAVPGQYTTMWFQATHEGTVPFFCAEYCGAAETGTGVRDVNGYEWAGHFSMMGHVVIENDRAFAQHLLDIDKRQEGLTPAASGALIYRSAQCYTCHSVDGAAMTGPTWQHMYGNPVQLTDGTTVTADENYLRESILNPQAKVVRGFNPLMPTYRGSLRDWQIEDLLAYMRTLR